MTAIDTEKEKLTGGENDHIVKDDHHNSIVDKVDVDVNSNFNLDIDDMLYAFDQEFIPSGKSSYTNLGNVVNGADEWRDDKLQKKRRANRLKRKKKDKHRFDKYDD